MSLIVNPTSVSFESILADLKAYVAGMGDDSWGDFVTSAAGTVVLEAMAGFGALLSHEVVTARRESMFDFARLQSSVTYMASMLGYPVNRRVSPKMRLTLNVSSSEATVLTRSSVVGSYGGVSLSILGQQEVLNQGINVIECGLGVWGTYQYPVVTGSDFIRLLVRDLTVENTLHYVVNTGVVSKDFPLLEAYIYPNSSLDVVPEPVVLVEYAEDMGKDTCLVKTHPDGVVLVFGDDVFGKRLHSKDLLVFNYFSTAGALTVTELSSLSSQVSVSVGTLVTAELLYPGSDTDSVAKMKAQASQYNAARRRMVTLDDHLAILGSYPGVVSTNVQRTASDGSCEGCSVEAVMLFEDEKVLDEYSSEIEDTGTISMSLSDDTVVFYDSMIVPSSVVVESTGFSSALVTGAKVWLDMIGNGGSTGYPTGISSGNFYWTIRLAGTDNIRFASSLVRAGNGTYLPLYAPVPEGQELDGTMTLSLYADTAKKTLSGEETIFEDKVEIASTFKISTAFDLNVVNSDPLVLVYVPQVMPALQTTPIAGFSSELVWAMKVPDNSGYLRFAASPNDAVNLNRTQLSAADSSGLRGSYNIYKLYDATLGYDIYVSGPEWTLSTGGSDHGYLSLPVTSFLVTTGGGGAIPANTQVRVRKAEVGTVLPTGLESGVVYYTVLDMEDPLHPKLRFRTVPNGEYIVLDDPGSTPSGGILLDVFKSYTNSGTTYYKETVALTSTTVVYETAYSESSSIDFTDETSSSGSIYFVNKSGGILFQGTKVRLYSEDATAVFPTVNPDPPGTGGLENGSFYYLIPITGTNRFRFAATYEDAMASTYVPFYPPSSSPPSYGLSGLLQMDVFSDEGSFPLEGSTVFYNNVDAYLSSLDFGPSYLTGNALLGYTGVPTGTKVKLFFSSSANVPVGFVEDTFYYIVRVPGTNNVRFAASRIDAMNGLYIRLSRPTSVVSGTVTAVVYGTPEEDLLRAWMDNYRVVGERVDFTDPIPVLLDPVMTVVVDPLASIGSIRTSIREVFEKRSYVLNATFYIGDVEKEILAIEGVVRCSIKQPTVDRQLGYNEYLTLKYKDNLFSSSTIKLTTDTTFVDMVLPEQGVEAGYN